MILLSSQVRTARAYTNFCYNPFVAFTRFACSRGGSRLNQIHLRLSCHGLLSVKFKLSERPTYFALCSGV